MRYVSSCVTLLAVAAFAVIAGTFNAGVTDAVAAAPASPAAPATHPAAGAGKQTFVLVHGAFAGGWEWRATGDLLTSRGHIAYRPTFTGQGEREHLASPEIDLNTYIDDVVNVIRFEGLKDIVLVGHSFGGMVVTGVADRVPERIKALIYVDAAVPIDGETRSTAGGAGAGRGPAASADGFLNMSGTNNPNRTPPYTVRMPAKAFSTPISLKNQEAALKIPTAYIMTVDPGRQPEQDSYFPFYSRAKERGWAVSIMTGDHVVHINQTANLVDRLEKAVLEAKPATAK